MKRALRIIGCVLSLVSSTLLFSQTTDSIPSTDYSDYKFKFGGGGGIGGAYVKPLGNFKEIRKDYGSVNFNILFSYGRIIYDFDIVLGNANAQGIFANDQLTIVEDSVVAVHAMENTLGIMIIDKRRMLVYPWVGISSTNVSQKNGIENNDGPIRTRAIGGLTLGYRFGDVFSETLIGSFEIRTKIAYTDLQYFDNLNISNIRIGLSFVFHGRGVKQVKTN